MAGILNNKERVIDFLITNQGKRQLSDGRMIVEYASFTDRHTFYHASASLEGISEDASNRIFFEAAQRHQDILVPEVDAGAAMQSFRAGYFNVEGRKIASGTIPGVGTSPDAQELTGTFLVDNISEFLGSLSTNFVDQRILQTKDLFSETTGFSLSAHTASFVITNDLLDFAAEPGTNVGQADVVLTNLPSISNSSRFQHLPNFQYLPPINVKDRSDEPDTPLADYPQYTSQMSTGNPFSSKQMFMDHIGGKQSVSFTFKETSMANNLIAQVFEVGDTNLEKLSIIDFGEFSGDGDDSSLHVFFVGRIRPDENGCHTYINLFTLVFE